MGQCDRDTVDLIPQPASPGVPAVTVRIFNTGILEARQDVMVQGGMKKVLMVPTLCALILHPDRGYLIFDTGYSTRFYKVTERLPYRILRKLTPVKISEEENLVSQIEHAGISRDEIGLVVLSHCHVDHVGGLLDFPRASIMAEAKEWEAAQQGSRTALLHGYLKDLYRGIGADRVRPVDLTSNGMPRGPFRYATDLFNDGSLVLILLDGHSPGNMGLMAHLGENHWLLFIGDAAWLRANYQRESLPAWYTRFILHDRKAYRRNLGLLRQVERDYPAVRIIPSHCPEAWAEVKRIGLDR